MRTINLLFVALFFAPSVVEAFNANAEFEQLSRAQSPVVAEGHSLSVAVIFPKENTAQLIVLQNQKTEVRSSAFEFHLTANYGGAWVEQIAVKSSSQFTVHMRTRQTCGPGVYDYIFAQRNGRWVVSGLERSESKCSDDGIVPSWRKSYNFLNGITESVVFENGRRKVASRQGQVSEFALSEFVALDSKYQK